MNPLDTLIEQEAAKLRLLKEQVAQREQRLATLKGMRGGDDMDTFLTSQLATAKPSSTGASGATKATTDEATSRRKGETKEAMLMALGPFPKHLKDVHKDANEKSGRDFNYKHVRTQVWQLAQGDAPLVESTKPGFYRLTPDGAVYVKKLESENPAGTGFSGAKKS